MKLTKLQRHTAYILMLHELQNNPIFFGENAGFCWVWNELNDGIFHYGMRKQFPELYSKRTNTPPFWFCCIEERIEAITQCINETA